MTDETFTGHWQTSKQGHLLGCVCGVACDGMPNLQAVTCLYSKTNLLVVLPLLL